ncbi:MAG: hypothetical protein Unbinned1606contig1000_31 [Prokaryotic dsDNA virus sp.]|nr:MAG: hypothetical protein Unbinned1606contig1000_31 [Prokaryotic dsDNA virus sp.]
MANPYRDIVTGDYHTPRYVTRGEGQPQFSKVADREAFRYDRTRDAIHGVDFSGVARDMGLGSEQAAKDWFQSLGVQQRQKVRESWPLFKTEKYGLMPFQIVDKEDLRDPGRRTDRGGDPTLYEMFRGELVDPVLDMLNINEKERHTDPFHGGEPRPTMFRAADKLNRDLGQMLGTEKGTATGGLGTLAEDYEENVAKPFRRDLPGTYVPMYAQGLGIWSPEEASAYRDRVTNRPNLAESIGYDPLNLFEVGALTKLVQGGRMARGAGSLEDIAKFRNLHTPARDTLFNRMTGEFDPGRRQAMGGMAAGAAALAGLKGATMAGPEAAKVASTVAHVSGVDPTGPSVVLEGLLKHGSDKGRAVLLDSIGDAARQSGKGGDPIEWVHRPNLDKANRRRQGQQTTRYESLGDLLKAEKRKVTSGDLKHLDHTDKDVQHAVAQEWGKKYPHLAKKFNEGTLDIGRYAEEQENLSKFWNKLYKYHARGRGAAKGLSFTEYANLPRTRKRIAKVEEANKYYLQHTPEGSMDEMMKSGRAEGASDVYGDDPLSYHAQSAGMDEDVRDIMWEMDPDEIEPGSHWFGADEAMDDLKSDMMYAMDDTEIWGDKSKYLGSLAHEGKRQYIPEVEQGLRQALGVETPAGQHAAQTLDDFLLHSIHEMERSKAASHPWPITRTDKHGLHELYGDEAIRYLQKQRMAVKKNGIFAADEGVLHEWADNDFVGYMDAKWVSASSPGPNRTIGTIPDRERYLQELTDHGRPRSDAGTRYSESGQQPFRLPFDKTLSVGPSQAPKRRVSLQESLKRAGAPPSEVEAAGGAFDAVDPPLIKMLKRHRRK